MNLRKALTRFSLILTIALFISGIALIGQYNDAAEELPSFSVPVATPTNELPENNDNSPYNILIIVEEKSVANDIYILNYSPITSNYSLLLIPGHLKTSENSRINSVIDSKGTINMINYIKANLGINIKYYLKMDYTAFAKAIDLLEGVTYTISSDFTSETTNLKAGTQVYTGKMAVELFRFIDPFNKKYTKELLEFYDGTPYARTLMHGEFMFQLLLQKGNFAYIPKFTQIIAECGKRIETNLTSENVADFVAEANNISIKRIDRYILTGVETDGYFNFNGKVKQIATAAREYTIDEVIITSFSSRSLS